MPAAVAEQPRIKTRVFLGALGVVPRRDFKRYFEYPEWRGFRHLWSFRPPADEPALLEALRDVFVLPHISTRTDPTDTDLALDVWARDFQRGELAPVEIRVPGFQFGFDFFWRPKVELVARLYTIDNDKTIKTYTVTERCTWKEFLARVLQRRLIILPFVPLFTGKDLQQLVYRATARLAAMVLNDI